MSRLRPMILQVYDTLSNCRESSSNPNLFLMTFFGIVNACHKIIFMRNCQTKYIERIVFSKIWPSLRYLQV